MQSLSTQPKSAGRKLFEVSLLIGTGGQGKSTFMSDAIARHEKTYSEAWKNYKIIPRAFVHDMSGARPFRHIPTIQQMALWLGKNYDHPMDFVADFDAHGYLWERKATRYYTSRPGDIERMYVTLIDHFRDGLLILDECSNYIGSNPKEHELIPVNNRRNYGWEVYYSFHKLLDVPNKFGRSANVANFLIWKTGEGEILKKEVRSKYSQWKTIIKAYETVMRTPETEVRTQPFAKVNNLTGEAVLVTPKINGTFEVKPIKV